MAEKASDKFIPWYFVLFFAAQAVLFGWFTHIAYKSYTGVVTDNAYEQGLKYNNVIAEAQEQAKLGWTMAISPAGSNGRETITVQLEGADGKGIAGATVKLWLIRPVQAGMDQHLVMQEKSGGLYEASTVLPARGLWEIRAEAFKDGHRFQAGLREEL